ncbi:NAD(P)-dependent oxidoreductase [Pelagibacterales bacterium]|nr:NAD(P)-dependent oxidoreductase [Pelagibacterales bacterium]
MATELLKKRHILIAGGTGYIGSYLSSKLTKAGHKVISVSRSIRYDKNHIRIDLTNEKTVIELAKNISTIDIIIHCAAIAHGERPPKNYSVADFNTTITKNLLKGFEGHQSHWIFISSISVYGDFYSKSQIPITFSPKSADNYGSGKIRDENLLISRCKHLDILRLMPVYDNENLHDIKKRVFLPKTNIKIIIRPSPLYSICNIEKVLSAVQKSMNYSYGQRIAQVGDAEPISQKELASWFTGKVISVPQLLFKFLFFLLPKKFISIRKIAFMFKKLGLNNIYEIGVKDIDSK